MKVVVEVVKASLGKASYRISNYSMKHSVVISSDYNLFMLMLSRNSHILNYYDVVRNI